MNYVVTAGARTTAVFDSALRTSERRQGGLAPLLSESGRLIDRRANLPDVELIEVSQSRETKSDCQVHRGAALVHSGIYVPHGGAVNPPSVSGGVQ